MIFHYNRYWPGATCGSNILTDNSINTDTNYVSSTSSQITFTRNVRARVVYSVEKIANGNVGQTLTPKINGNAVPGASPATLPTATNGHWTGSEVTGNLQEFTYSFKTNDALSFDFCVPDSGYNAFDIRIYALEGGGGSSAISEATVYKAASNISWWNYTYTFTQNYDNVIAMIVVGNNVNASNPITVTLNSATGTQTSLLSNSQNTYGNSSNGAASNVSIVKLSNISQGDTITTSSAVAGQFILLT